MRPFDKKNKNWHENIYVPAIKSAGLTPVLGGGAGADELRKDIEKKIRNARICLADISEDNANVLIEVGIALGLNKPIVFVRHHFCYYATCLVSCHNKDCQKGCHKKGCHKGCHKDCQTNSREKCHKKCSPNAAKVPSNIRDRIFVPFKDSEPEQARDEILKYLMAKKAASASYSSLLRMMWIGE